MTRTSARTNEDQPGKQGVAQNGQGTKDLTWICDDTVSLLGLVPV